MGGEKEAIWSQSINNYMLVTWWPPDMNFCCARGYCQFMSILGRIQFDSDRK